MARGPKSSYELSEAEQRDIISLIQQGKPLPERYRFVLFEDKREVELVWNGKTRDVCTTVLPFQSLEHIDEPRKETKLQADLFDGRGRQLKGWTNKLVWGDNKLILSSLKAGPLRQQIEEAGGLKLIYIDPPFDVGADFSMDVEVGGETFHKEPNLLEQIAYRDTWGRGADSFIAMIYERLILMRDLLSAEGSIYVHCDPRVNSYMRLILDEVFGRDYFRNELIWKRTSAHADTTVGFGGVTDTIYFYSKSDRSVWNSLRLPLDPSHVEGKYTYREPDGRRYATRDLRSPNPRPNLTYEYKGYKPHPNGWSISPEKMAEYDRAGRLYFPSSPDGRIRMKIYLDESDGLSIQNLWSDISPINSQAQERAGYPTQKPETLLERIIKSSSNEGDLNRPGFAGGSTL